MCIKSVYISKCYHGDENCRREWKPSIVCSRLATLLRLLRGHLRSSAMVCDASRTPKLQENDQFHYNVWQGLNTIHKFIEDMFYGSLNSEALYYREHCAFHCLCLHVQSEMSLVYEQIKTMDNPFDEQALRNAVNVF